MSRYTCLSLFKEDGVSVSAQQWPDGSAQVEIGVNREHLACATYHRGADAFGALQINGSVPIDKLGSFIRAVETVADYIAAACVAKPVTVVLVRSKDEPPMDGLPYVFAGTLTDEEAAERMRQLINTEILDSHHPTANVDSGMQSSDVPFEFSPESFKKEFHIVVTRTTSRTINQETVTC
jgi:hypothetical protein